MLPLVLKHSAPYPTPGPVAFLDRDGVLIENRPDYVRSPRDVVVLPRAAEAVRLLAAHGYRIVVVTNQSAVGQELVDVDTARRIDRHVVSRFGVLAGTFLATYMCPHRADAGCPCRKPSPHMVLRAMADFDVPAAGSFMIGDAATDVVAGLRAGLDAALVRSGRGGPADIAAVSRRAAVYDDLLDAVASLLHVGGTAVPRRRESVSPC